jgi:hypothetical protein
LKLINYLLIQLESQLKCLDEALPQNEGSDRKLTKKKDRSPPPVLELLHRSVTYAISLLDNIPLKGYLLIYLFNNNNNIKILFYFKTNERRKDKKLNIIALLFIIYSLLFIVYLLFVYI